MNLASLLTLVISVTILIFGYRVYLLDTKKETYRLFFAIAGIGSFLCYCWYEMSQTTVPSEAVFYFHLSGVWVFIFPLIVYLLWGFTGYNKKMLPTWVKTLGAFTVFLPSFYFFYQETFSGFGYEVVVPMDNGQWGMRFASLKPWYILQSAWILLNSALSICLVYYFYKRGQERKKWKRNALILFSLCISASFIQNHIVLYFGAIWPVNESITTLMAIGLFGWLVIGFRLSELEPEKGMDKVIYAMTNLMILTNEKYFVQKINPAALSFFEMEEAEVIGQSLELLIGFQNLQVVKNLSWSNNWKNDKEFVLQRQDDLAHLLVSASPIFNKRKKLMGYALVGTDLTKLKMHEYKLSVYTRKIQQSNEQLRHFAYITSHDLKEPLRNISNYATKLERELYPILQGEMGEYFGFITEGVKRMYNIIESIKEVSDINHSVERMELVDTSHLIRGVEEKLHTFITEKDARIRKSALPKIQGNPKHFELLFFNLIENALKFNKSENPQVIISCEKENGYYIFSVEDNGIGVEPEFSEYIFKMFKRLHSRAHYEGVGMGLAICKSVVEKNGGRIWAESNSCDGTTIRFTLPRIKNNTYHLLQPKLAAVVV